MGLLVALVVGGVFGWLASLLAGTNQRTGPLGDIAVGVLGALLGSVLANAVGVELRAPATAYLAALTGSVVLVALLRGLGVFRGRRTR
jgi:uncharacterized membrane protein YeaQ/YmgE (transglycosylase-associated protein family)